jgi:glutathione synthase/RimK-type ligase-like ATP-grasp enzyme
LAQDKVATYEVLSAADISAVPHVLARSLPGEPIHKAELKHGLAEGDIVIKPLSGTGGRGVERYAELDAALEFIQTSPEPAWAISPYLEIVSETRFIMFGGKALLAYEKQQPEIKNGLKFYNLSHGAVAVDIPDPEIQASMCGLAERTCRELGLKMAAVDIVSLEDGSQMVLEVNDGFSMEYYARQGAEYKKRAIELYDTIVASMFGSPS